MATSGGADSRPPGESRHTDHLHHREPEERVCGIQGYSVGAVDYIFKPVSADMLVSKVNVFVDLYRRSRALKRQAQDLRQAHDELDLRVRERTEELARANSG